MFKLNDFKNISVIYLICSYCTNSFAATQASLSKPTITLTKSISSLSLKEKLKLLEKKQTHQTEHFIFDLPVTYNGKVSKWIAYYQTKGKTFFRNWLERASKYMPYIQNELKKAGLPADLGYMVMIESGFSSNAISTAQAVGPWQFIPSTAKAFGLEQTYWLDERRDLQKSTQAAIKYLKALHSEFGSWYLVAASYNMGENGLRRQILKHKTKDYWELVAKGALPLETQEYVPKILAALMIAKAPNLYGFRNLDSHFPLQYEFVKAPGGTDLDDLANYLNITKKALKDLNSELILGFVPKNLYKHWIRVPIGSSKVAQQFFNDQNKKFALD